MDCPACLQEMNPVEAAGGRVCLACCIARATAARDGRCHCRGRKRRPGKVLTTGGYKIGGEHRGGRSWIPCERCLGTIEQLS